MLTANHISGQGSRKDVRFEVVFAGAVIGTINDTRRTFDLGNQSFTITSTGVLGPKLELKCGDRVVATASQKPLVNNYTVSFGGKEWTFKATNMLASKFGLFDNDQQIGTVSSGSFFSRLKGITAELPDELPQEVQILLISILIAKLTEVS